MEARRIQQVGATDFSLAGGFSMTGAVRVHAIWRPRFVLAFCAQEPSAKQPDCL